MPTRPSKPRLDVNQIAFATVQRAIGEAPSEATETPEEAATEPGKNPAAVALGKLGASKGGNARAAKLTPKKRSAIAKKAAKARWDDPKKSAPV